MKQFGKIDRRDTTPTVDRHQVMMRAMEPYAKAQAQKNLTPVVVQSATRRTKLLLMLLMVSTQMIGHAYRQLMSRSNTLISALLCVGHSRDHGAPKLSAAVCLRPC